MTTIGKLGRTSHFVLAMMFIAATDSPAIAQEPAATTDATPNSEPAQPDTAAAGTPDIVVTAQFREQRLQDTPLAITAVNAATLEARSQTNIVDVGAFAPNVNLSQATSINGNAVAAFIRGIGQDDSNFALEPGVGVYIDDVYFGTTFGASFDLTDLDRVEVLRGPQGTLAGKNSLGGAIKLFTRKPDERGGGYVEATYGRFNRVAIRASAGFTIADGLYARISGVKDRRDGYFKLLDYGCVNPGSGVPAIRPAGKCKLGTQGGLDVAVLRGAIRYAPAGSPLEINLSADYVRNDNENVATKTVVANTALSALPHSYRTYDPANPFGGVPFDSRFITGKKSYSSYENNIGAGNYTTIFGFPYQVPPGTFTDDPENSANSYGFSGTIDYRVSDSLSIKSITAYRKAWGTTVLEIDGAPMSILKERLHNVHKQFTQELRVSGKIGDFADFTVGGFYYKANDLEEFRIMIPTFLYDFVTHDPIKNRSVAGFAHLELHPTDKLNIIGGIRYTKDKKDYTFHRANLDGSLPVAGPFVAPSGGTYPSTWVFFPFLPGLDLVFPQNFLVAGLDGLKGKFKDDRIDYRLGANYHWSDNLMTYVQVATGYKGGGINPRPFVADQVLSFGPEKVLTIEGGVKAEMLDRRVRLNGAVFYNTYKDIQRTLFVCPFSTSVTCSLPANAGDGHSYGAELELFARPIDGLTIDGSLGYLNFKYDKVDPLTFVTKDMVAPFNSKWTASAGVQYRADLGTAGSLTPRLDWSYQSSFFYNAVNNPFNKVAGRSLFNGRLTYETADDGWSLSASVTNLFNKFYYVGYSENISNFGLNAGLVGRPREWAVTLKKKF